MSDVQSLISKLQAEAVNPEASVTNLLRVAKIVATKLNLGDALVWIDRELTGYMDLAIKDLPPYRRLTGAPKAYNPFYGWQPIHFRDAKTAKFLSEAAVGQALGAIEKTIRNKESGSYVFPYPHEIKLDVQKAIEVPTDVHVEVQYGQLWNIIEQVRNLILNWALDLEKAGVVGENMQFSETEQENALPVTQQFFIQNVGILGNVTGDATVSNQRATVDLHIGRVKEFVATGLATLASLPPSPQAEARSILRSIEEETKANTPNTSRIREWLISLRRICEGVTGSVAAQGLLAMLKMLLGP
jgi:AbiTii